MPDGKYDSCGNGIVTDTTEADILSLLKLEGKKCAQSDDEKSAACVDAQNIAKNLQTRYSYCMMETRLYRENAKTGECNPNEPVEL